MYSYSLFYTSHREMGKTAQLSAKPRKLSRALPNLSNKPQKLRHPPLIERQTQNAPRLPKQKASYLLIRKVRVACHANP